jgi:hypothetical protein
MKLSHSDRERKRCCGDGFARAPWARHHYKWDIFDDDA